jgi:hypothetical protein
MPLPFKNGESSVTKAPVYRRRGSPPGSRSGLYPDFRFQAFDHPVDIRLTSGRDVKRHRSGIRIDGPKLRNAITRLENEFEKTDFSPIHPVVLFEALHHVLQ